MPGRPRRGNTGAVANPVLMKLSRNDRVRRLTTAMPVTRQVVDRFVAGSTEDDALTTLRELVGRGLTATVDRLGEDVTDRAQADATATAYVGLLERLRAADLVPAAEVSLKLSAMGQALGPDGPAISVDNARRVCEAAAAAGTTVSVDMEDHTTVDATLEAVAALRADFPWVAAVVQASLRRTEGDLASLVGPGSRVRLVKGAYAEPASVAFETKAEVDDAYARDLRILMNGEGHPQVATHDPSLVAAAERMVVETGRASDSYEFQMLFGIRTGEQQRLHDAGHRVRVYVPYGDDWYGYFMRRLAERPANVGFFVRALVSR